MLNNILSNRTAVFGLPTYILVATIVSITIIIILSNIIFNIRDEVEYYQIKHTIEKIIFESENMYEYADEGSKIIVHVQFPQSMKFASFGDLPNNRCTEPYNLSIDENTSNNYYYVMKNGRISVYHSTVRFSSKNHEEIAIIYPGSYDLTLELVNIDGKTYVKIY
jgi:hypothetical protein